MGLMADGTQREQKSASLASHRVPPVDIEAFLARTADGHSVLSCTGGEVIFSQGEKADSIFFLLEGAIKLTVISKLRREALLSVLRPGTFFGESCLSGKAVRRASAQTIEACRILCIPKATMLRSLRTEPTFSELFVTHLLSHAVQIEGELLDHLFNSCEKRLARVLLVMADFGKKGRHPRRTLPKVTQKLLAEMVGATTAQVSFFLKSFRARGYIETTGVLQVHNSLLAVVLQD